MSALPDLVERYGANPAGLLPFDGDDTPSLLPYATLVGARRSGSPDLAALSAVYEWQDSPLVFLVDGDRLQDEAHLLRIRRRVALRADAPYLGVVRSRRLTVHAVALDNTPAARSEVPLEVAEPVIFPYLAAQRPRAAIARDKWIADLILRLLQDALRALRGAGLGEEDAISLAGRALFSRFLADRDLVPSRLATPDEVQYLFDDADRTMQTSKWLDDTFNGDFLPLTPGVLATLPPDAYRVLGYIMRRAAGGQLYLGWEQGWDYLDFAQIPVGVLRACEFIESRRLGRRKIVAHGARCPENISET
jgi:hypothetical protein